MDRPLLLQIKIVLDIDLWEKYFRILLQDYYTNWISTWEYILGSRCLKEEEGDDDQFRRRHDKSVEEPGAS